MANTKISALTADTAPTADDLVVIVNDPGGTPATRKATVTNLTKAIPVVIGDAGAGGTKGLVPAPAAGDAAAGKFLKADGAFAVPTGTGAETGANSDITSMDGLTGALENPTKIIFPEAAAPATPAASKVALYAKADGLLYSKDDAGAETLVSGGAGGAGPATQIDETSGPTTLDIAAIADGEYLRRSGTDIIGDTPSSGSTFAGGGFEQFKLMAMQVPPGGGTNVVYGGMGSSPLIGGVNSQQDDDDGHWLRRTTGASTDGDAGETANLGNLARITYLPQLTVKMKTHTSIAVCRLWVGFFAGSPMASDDPAMHGMGFRYAPATDGTAFWRTWTNDGSGGGTVTTTGQSIVVSTIYHLAIKVVSTSSVEFYISTDGGVTYILVATHTANLPSTGMDYYCAIRTLENVDKGIQHSWTQVRQR